LDPFSLTMPVLLSSSIEASHPCTQRKIVSDTEYNQLAS
jgi:hypothetical protein